MEMRGRVLFVVFDLLVQNIDGESNHNNIINIRYIFAILKYAAIKISIKRCITISSAFHSNKRGTCQIFYTSKISKFTPK